MPMPIAMRRDCSGLVRMQPSSGFCRTLAFARAWASVSHCMADTRFSDFALQIEVGNRWLSLQHVRVALCSACTMVCRAKSMPECMARQALLLLPLVRPEVTCHRPGSSRICVLRGDDAFCLIVHSGIDIESGSASQPVCSGVSPTSRGHPTPRQVITHGEGQ